MVALVINTNDRVSDPLTRRLSEDEYALIGSLSVVLGKPIRMDSLLPDWLEKGVEPSLRDSEDDKPIAPAVMAISSTSQRSKAMAIPVTLTPTSASRPNSRQENTKGVFAQDLESFYADAIDSQEEESEESGKDEQSQDEVHHDENDDSSEENGSAEGSSGSDDETEESTDDDEVGIKNEDSVISR